MNEFDRPTAKIYQFPVKRRAPAQRSHGRDAQQSQAKLGPAVRIEYGSGWYHDAAIHDEINGGKH